MIFIMIVNSTIFYKLNKQFDETFVRIAYNMKLVDKQLKTKGISLYASYSRYRDSIIIIS